MENKRKIPKRKTRVKMVTGKEETDGEVLLLDDPLQVGMSEEEDNPVRQPQQPGCGTQGNQVAVLLLTLAKCAAASQTLVSLFKKFEDSVEYGWISCRLRCF